MEMLTRWPGVARESREGSSVGERVDDRAAEALDAISLEVQHSDLPTGSSYHHRSRRQRSQSGSPAAESLMAWDTTPSFQSLELQKHGGHAVWVTPIKLQSRTNGSWS